MLETAPPPTSTSHQSSRPIAVIGGGITGLAAAWELQQRQQPYVLLEANGRWGGKLTTDYIPLKDVDANTPDSDAHFTIEGGAESFVSRKPEVWQLAREMGITDSIVAARNEARHIYILTNGKPLELHTHPLRFLRSPLLSWRGKLRLMAEPFIKARRDWGDESIADFVSRRLGAEAHTRMIGPILGGIYNTDTNEQSILVSSPIMREMERDFGGLVRGMFGRMKQRKAQKAAAEASGEAQPPASFITFAQGTAKFIAQMVGKLTGDLRLNSPVQNIEADGDAYRITLTTGESLSVSAIIIATPANTAAPMLAAIAPDSAAQLRTIQHNNLGTISLIYRSDDLTDILPFSGLMIPRREKRRIDAITWTSRKDRERTPDGYDVLRVFFGGGDPTTATMSEADLLAVVQAELRDLLGITLPPRQYSLARWVNQYVQAPVGHLALVDAIDRDLPAGIAVAGASYRGLAVPDCIRQGREAAQRIAQPAANLSTA